MLLNLALNGQGKYFLDGGNCVQMGLYGTSAFQMVTDTIVNIMKKPGCQLCPYIDNFVGVVKANKADSHFQFLALLLRELGLPLNWDKYTPPATQLTCLGIVNSIPDFTLYIDQEKLNLIYQECL